MQIREMQEEDLEQVCAIENANFSMPWSKKSFTGSIHNSEHVYIVAEEQGEILGYCGMWIVLDEGQINNVAVKNEHRRKGIAKAMMKEFLWRGEEKGAMRFTLEVRESNQGAIALYEQLGFYTAGIRKNFYEKPVEHAVIMWKEKISI